MTSTRTLLIGLGGTGEEVLKQFCLKDKLHIERSTKIEGLFFNDHPFPSLASASDTSRSENLQITSVDLSIDLKMLQTLTTQNNPKGEKSAQWGDYHWLLQTGLQNPRSIIGDMPRSRLAGRFHLFFHHAKIYAHLQAALKQLTQQASTQEPIEILVVSSLCGGLGSGIVFDIAYIIRQLLEPGQYRLVGYLTVAPDAYGGSTQMYANTYAALRELSHYSTSANLFKANYPASRHTPIKSQDPPFDYVYCISDRASTSEAPQHWSEICNLIAQKIKWRVSPDVGAIIAKKEDALHRLQSTEQQTKPIHVLSFGLTELHAEAFEKNKLSQTQLLYDTLHFWRYGIESSEKDLSSLDRFLLSWSPQTGDQNPIVAVLKTKLLDGEQSFETVLRNWQNHLVKQIEIRNNRRLRHEFRENLEALLYPMLTSVEIGATSEASGVWIQRLGAIAPEVQAQISLNILQFLETQLDPCQVPFGFQSIRQWLDALLTKINEWQRELEHNVMQLSQSHKNIDINNQIRAYTQILEDLEPRGEILWFKDNKQQQYYQIQAKAEIFSLGEYIQQKIHLVLSQIALQICQTLQKEVQALIRDCRQACFQLQAACFNALQQVQALDVKPDYPSTPNGKMPERDRIQDPLLISQSLRFLEESLPGINLVEVITHQKPYPFSSFIEALTKNSQAQEIESNDLSTSVVTYLLQTTVDALSLQSLKKHLDEAQPRLPLSSDTLFPKALIVAFNTRPQEKAKKLIDILNHKLDIPINTIHDIKNDRIFLILKVLSSFPLESILGLTECKQAYEKYDNPKAFHIDANIEFTDRLSPIPVEQIKEEKIATILARLKAYQKQGLITDSDLKWLRKQHTAGKITSWEFDYFLQELSA